MDRVAQNRAVQTEAYGEPLDQLLKRCTTALSLTQGSIATLLGVSAPMLSQLINGRRAKLGNPAAAARLHRMRELLIDVEANRLTSADAVAQLEANQQTDAFTLTGHQPDARTTVREIQELFRATASAADYLAAAEHLEADQPAIAELLRIYGASRTDEAIRHFNDRMQQNR